MPEEKFKKYFKKPKELELYYLSWNIILSMSTKFAQIKAIGDKIGPAKEGHWCLFMYIVKTKKKIFFKTPKS
jgi:hypothetical protein